MSFFEPPDRFAAEEPRRAAAPPWLGPPEAEVAVVLPVERTLARTEDALVGVRSVAVQSTGFSVAVASWRRGAEPPWELMLGFGVAHPRGGRPPASRLRLGVAFGDGTKATTLDPFPGVRPGRSPQGPVFFARGEAGPLVTSFWVWPLPPPGPLAVVAEWPSEDIPETRLALDAEAIRAAAARAEPVWPEAA